MNNLVNILFEQIKKGNIDKNDGSKLIKMLLDQQNERNGIAIIGMAGRFPGADNTDKLWEVVRERKDCISSLPLFREWDCMDIHNKLNPLSPCEFGEGGYLEEIDKFDYSFFHITPNEAVYMDPSQRLFLETAFQALEDAGYTGSRLEDELVGVYAGYSSWPIYAKLLSAEQVDEYSDAFTGGLSSMIPARLSYHLNLKGPSVLVDTACSSSLSAVHIACNALYSGDCKIAVAGGVNIRMLPYKMVNEYGIDALDSRTKAFDEAADGTAWGEGVAVICLKPLRHAMQDGDNIHAVIWGSALNHDGHTVNITTPNVESQVSLQCRAWDKAGIYPENITLLEAHGTGTSLGDAIEIEAINRAMIKHTDNRQFCAIGSLKTNIGHLDGASGIAGIIKLVYALKNRELPPMLHFELPNQKMDFINSPIYINSKLRKWNDEKCYCAISSFGISGTNCYAVLGSAPEAIELFEDNKSNLSVHILALSAKSPMALQKLIVSYCDFVKNNTDKSIYDICYTAAVGRNHYEYRFAMVAYSHADLLEKLEKTCLALEWGSLMPEECYIYSKVFESDENNSHELDELVFFRNNKSLAYEICEKYCHGDSIDWKLFYPKGRIISLPLYPFDKVRCWYPLEQKKYTKYLYKTQWKSFDLTDKPQKAEMEHYLIFYTDCQTLRFDIGEELRRRNHCVAEIIICDDAISEKYNKMTIRNTEEEFLRIYNQYPDYNKVVFINHEIEAESEYVWLEWGIQNKLFAFVNCLKGLSNRTQYQKADAYLVCNGISDVMPGNEVHPINASLAGVGKSFNTENTLSRCHCIDYDAFTFAEEIVDAIFYDYPKYQIALREHNFYAEYIHWLSINECDYQPIEIKSQGAYIITGGFGGIGIQISRYLSSLKKVNLVFFNRSEMPPEEQWDTILELGIDQSMCRKLLVAKEIRKLGSSIYCYRVDVSEQQQLSEAINQVRERFGKINGIIHSAGIAGSGLIIKKEFNEFERILRPKVYGTWLLDHLTREDDLEFFLLFSSGVSMFGDPGHCDYMAANAYMDAYEAYRNRLGYKTVTINWTGWKEIGMSVDLGVNVDAAFKQISTTDALRSFHYIFHRNIHRALIGEFNTESNILHELGEERIPFYLSPEFEKYLTGNFDRSQAEINEEAHESAFILQGRETGEYTELEIEIGEVWHSILGYSHINVRDNFFELGGDSIKAVQMMLRIKHLINNEDIYRCPVLEEFCRLIESREHSKFGKASNEFKLTERVYHYPELPAYKMINGIQPFNGIFFKDCFYNAIFSILGYYGRDITPFLVNEVIVYKAIPKEVGNNLKAQYISVEPIDVLMQESYIGVDVPEKKEDMIEVLLNSISEDRPAIIRIDCFYEPFRKDTYHEIHWSHAVLVYGYDMTRKEFLILEHENINSQIYKQMRLSFDDLLLCWEGYVKNFYEKEGIPILISIFRKAEGQKFLLKSEYLNTYFNNIHKYRAEIRQGLQEFEGFIDYVRWLLKKEERSKDELYYYIIQIIKAKQSEMMILDTLDVSALYQLKETLTETIILYQYIARQLGRYKALQRLEEERRNKIIEKLIKISNLQQSYYEILFEQIDLTLREN